MLGEAAYILRRHRGDADPLLALIECGVLKITFCVESEPAPPRQLMRRYREQPMSLAGASSGSLTSRTSPASG